MRFVSLSLIVLLSLSAAFAASSKGGQAAVSLSNASAALSQSSDTEWKLAKEGELDAAHSSVTWTITVTQGITVSGHLFVNGFVTVTNSGTAGATIGNIVVNLQTKSGLSWKTQSSDIADATHGDDANTAHIDPHASSENLSSFSENAASGQLQFMDANDNTLFSLKPQKTIAPGKTVNLLFAAEFDNTVLKLANGATVRAEVIVSFGNSTSVPPSAPNVDINGNGTIDRDEAWVRSVPARLTLSVPAQTAANSTTTLTDTSSDIATTGTVTFSNPSFDLGVLTGTVTAQVDGGASGGTITNCAHLKGTGSTTTVGGFKFPNVPGVDQEACNTQTIPPANSCTPGTVGCGWKDGDVITYSQGAWGDTPSGTNAAAILQAHYDTVYASSFGVLEVGIPGSAGFSISFTNYNSILAYLPASGPIGALTSDVADPTSTSSGDFGGEVTALRLNIDFADAGVTLGASGLKFGDLTLCGFTTLTALNGITVRQFSGILNTLLGGGTFSSNINTLDPVAFDLNRSFEGSAASTFAQQHLANGHCPAWQNGALTTYSQSAWGEGGLALEGGAALLVNHYGAVYAPSFLFTIGSASGFTAVWSDPTILSSYLPATGPAGVLTANLANPTSTSSGQFGGDVAALKLNIDFADAGFLSGNSNVKFGDLTLCGLAFDTDLNGMTVRQVLDIVNTALGGGTTTDSISDLDAVANQLNASFGAGTPSTFALQHLAKSSACQAVNLQNGDLITYGQNGWSAANNSILNNHYGAVYAPSFLFTIGSASGFTAVWSDPTILSSYLPATGPAGVLTANLADPTSTSSGQFGGDVAALKLNIDFNDAGVLSGNTNVKFGDLRLCGLTSTTDLNFMTVRQVLDIVNTALGGGTTTDSITALDAVATQLNGSFFAGTPSPFAQQHLVNGACP